ncbi:MAG TPA: hypothetical protein PK544_07060 [Spirochaetota bacterium]|nr:hypothetical protein [Spirochaetota bacterium]HPJ39455.1 hypothetical protein [Spirochaetota bacterium]HPQ54042.1 hypothetical protein [Spirochaetota bacterium]
MNDEFVLDFEDDFDHLFRDEELLKVSTDIVRQHLEFIIAAGLPIRRKKKDGSFGFVPPKDFDIYLKDREMEFYLDHDSFQQLQDQITNTEKTVERETPAASVSSTTPAVENTGPSSRVDTVFENRLAVAREMDIIERIQSLMNHNHKLKEYTIEGKRFDADMMDETGKMFAENMCISKVTLEENIEKGIDQGHIKKMVSESFAMIDNLISLLSRGKATYSDLARLHHIQTQSVTLNHMNRILIRYISFLFFYNSYFQKYSNNVKRFRAEFDKRFYPYYNKLFRGSQKISLEIVYKGGITPVRERSSFIDFAMGGFIHDIGKLPQVDYHDGGEGYDPKKARRHVFESYNMLIESKEFNTGIVSTGLLHHDYYGAPYGYRQLGTFQSRFEERRGSKRDTSPTKYCISYNINDVGYGNTLSYFPNKILEIIDVYDAMTDSEKKYRSKPMTPGEALTLIRKDFLEGDYLGIDPILFDIFADFLHESGVIRNPDFIKEIKI